MAQLIQERVISGKGTLQLEPLTEDKYRYYLLYIDVIRLPKNEYKNFKHNPYESFYANCCFVSNGYVTSKRQIEHTTERWTIIPDIAGQGLIALKCHLDATFQSIINLGASLGAFPVSIENPIKDYTNLNLEANELWFVCYSSAAIRLRLYGEEYDTCNADYDKQDRGGEPPPPEPGSVPPDDPVIVSPPYNDETNDGGNFNPFPGDAPEDNFFGDNCVAYEIVVRVIGANFENGFADFTLRIFGEYRVFIDPNNETRPVYECRGVYVDAGSVCGELEIFEIGVNYTPPLQIFIISESVIN